MAGGQTIDIHAHYYPDSYLKLIEDEGPRFGASYSLSEHNHPIIRAGGIGTPPLGRAFIGLDERIAAMDDQGVGVHALSMTMPMVDWAGGDLARRMSEAFNDALAQAHDAHPDRLFGLAILPMNDPVQAVAELERAAGLPGIRGVYMSTRILDRELSDEAFLPIFERIEDAGLPLFLHPLNVIGAERLERFYLGNLLGNPFDSAVAAAHLIFGGVLDRFPKLEVCLPHAGGAFPYLVGRLQRGFEVRPELKHMEKGPVEYLRRFTYDTISHSDAALGYLIDLVGADRVMLGSDYCFGMGYDRPVEVVTGHAGLTDEDRDLILGGNARRLLGL